MKTKNWANLIAGLGLAGVAILLPMDASAEVRYRVSGTACSAHFDQTHSDAPTVTGSATSGLKLEYDVGDDDLGNTIQCALPTGPDLIELGSGNPRLFSHVSVRVKGTPRGGHTCWLNLSLIAHSYTSSDFAVCDMGGGNAASTSYVGLDYDPSCVTNSSWGLVVDSRASDFVCTSLEVKLLTVHDVN